MTDDLSYFIFVNLARKTYLAVFDELSAEDHLLVRGASLNSNFINCRDYCLF
jgi:hypothetical protein